MSIEIPEVNVDFDSWDVSSKAHADQSVTKDDPLDFSEIEQIASGIGTSPRDMSKPPAREPPKPLPGSSAANAKPATPASANQGRPTPALPARTGNAPVASFVAARPMPSPAPRASTGAEPNRATVATAAAAAHNDPPDIDDLDAMVNSLDQFANGTDDDDRIDILSKDDEPLPEVPRANAWVASQSKPVSAKPRANAVSQGSAASSPASGAVSPALTRTSRVASNLANSASNNTGTPAPGTSAPTRASTQQELPAPLQKQNTLGKLSSKIFTGRASNGQVPTPINSSNAASSAPQTSSAPPPSSAPPQPPSNGGGGGEALSPRLLSPRAPVENSSSRPLAPLGKPDLDDALLAAADRYRKMSSAISDLTKKQQAQMQQVDGNHQLVAKVLQKAEKQGLAPSPVSSQTAAVVQRLSTLSLATCDSTARAFDGMGKTVDTIDSVRASLRQQHLEREQFDTKVAKYLKDKEKSKKSNDLPEVERSLKADRERLDEQLAVCDSTMREVFDRKEDITAGFLTTMLDAMLVQARAQAALIPELERLAQAARMSMASGDEKRRISSVYQEADEALATAAAVNGVTDQQTLQIVEARGALIRDRGSRVAALAQGPPANKGPAAQQGLLQVLIKHDLAALNAMCVTGRANESALLEHVCFALDGNGLLLQTIEQGVSKVVATSEHEQTLFRSNTETTKLIGAFTKLHGLAYLQHMLQPLIERLKTANEDYEIDASKGSLSDEVVAANSARLRTLTTQFFTALTGSAEQVPAPLRAIAAHLHKEVGRRYPEAARSSVGGYICLRFVCPAMMTPRAFGVVTVDPPARAVRALTLVSKIIQNIANGIEFKKELFMVPFNDFVLANQAGMNGFIDKVIVVPRAKLDAMAPLATREQAAQRDLPTLHYFMATNIGKMTKTMCDYKQYEAVAPFVAAVSDAGVAPTTKPATLQNV